MSDLAELRIGIIGLGIGRFHASCFSALPGVRIVAIADRGGRRLPGPLAEFAAHYGARPYSLGEEMIAEETLDAVSICSPPASHRALVERAAARGMQVLLEKPMAWSLDRLRRDDRRLRHGESRTSSELPDAPARRR